MRTFLFVLIVFSCTFFYAQEQQVTTQADSIDVDYREDQFYFGVAYNLLGNKPENLAQNGFSTGIQLGYIRDFPLNAKRTLAFGVGLGYAYSSLNQNLQIQNDAQGQLSYQIVSSDMFTRNRISMHVVELPLEVRWRSSSFTNYNFWRIYAGLKFGYVFASKYTFRGSPEDFSISNLTSLRNLQFGLTFSAGYDKINLNFYYGLSSLLNNSATLNNTSIDSNLVKIGLIVYIL